MGYLADVNFVVALLHARHTASERAAAWLAEQSEPGSLLLCRVVQMGTLRILTNPAWLKEEVLPARAVWQAWDLLLTDERFATLDEPPGLETAWRRLTEGYEGGRCAETDTYLAAFAIAAGHRMVTFDRGFGRFDGLEALVLE